MKKKLFLVLSFLFIYYCFAQDNNNSIEYDFTGKLNEGQLKFMKDYYEWNSHNILIINFTQPRSNCHYDNHKHNKNGVKWFKEYYSEINLQDCEVIFVCPEKHKRHSSLYYDKADFLFKNYFSRKKSCHAIMVLNKNGDYLQYNGEYSKNQISKFIENLKSIL